MKKNEISGITEHFVVDKWCLLANIKVDAEYNQTTRQPFDFAQGKLDNQLTELYFDLDMYKILLRFLNKTENHDKIQILQQSQIQEFFPQYINKI